MTSRCQIPRCLAEADVSYLGHGVCTQHWDQLTNETAPPDAMRKALGIASEPEWENTHMASKQKTQPIEQPAADTTQPQTDGATAPTTKKKAKVPKAEKAPRPEKTPREPKAKEPELVVFALRMTEAERDALHKTAGP